MDANSDEANRCLLKAQEYLRHKEFEKAERMVEKSLRMFPSKSAQQMKETIERSKSEGAPEDENRKTFSAKSNTSDPPRNRTNSNSETPKHPSKANQHHSDWSPHSTPHSHRSSQNRGHYSTEQKELVDRIMSTTDYYEILAIPKTAKEDGVKKAYKKFALLLHPDKCKHPKSEEAFKKLSMVVQTLSDPEKRAIYDQYGENESANEQTQHYEGEFMTPEDLFEVFFGVSTTSRRRQRRTYRRAPTVHHHTPQGNQGFLSFMQFASVFILVIISFFGSYLVEPSVPSYRFVPDAKYHLRFSTGDPSHVEYFVSSQASRDIPDGSKRRKELDEHVEFDFFHHQCESEKKKYWLEIEQIRSLPRHQRETARQDLQARYHTLFPSCQKIRQLSEHHHRKRDYTSFSPFGFVY